MRQSYELYQYFQQKIRECDREIELLLNEKIRDNEKLDGEARLEYNGDRKPVCKKNDIGIDMAGLSYQLTGGVDLFQIEGIGKGTLLTLLSETGTDMKSFPDAKHFTSWLHLSPNNKKTGGKVFSRRTAKGKNRLADALRHAANSVGNKKEGSLRHFFKRIEMRKGRLTAITATARKLAVIIYNMLAKSEVYKPADQTEYLNKIRTSQIRNLQRKINQLKVISGELNFAII